MFKLAVIAFASTMSLVLLYAVVFIPLESLFPSKPQAKWRCGSLTDALYWFLLSPVNQLYSMILAGAVSALSIWWHHHRQTPPFMGGLPAWVQALFYAF